MPRCDSDSVTLSPFRTPWCYGTTELDSMTEFNARLNFGFDLKYFGFTQESMHDAEELLKQLIDACFAAGISAEMLTSSPRSQRYG